MAEQVEHELIARYVQQVGRYLPRQERAEIEVELRSQIEDQLEGRYGAAPSPAQVVATLTELGAPRQLAASYGTARYLVGPDLYPAMIMILRHGWLIMSALIVFLGIFGAILATPQRSWLSLLVETVITLGQTLFTFSGVVVLFFAIIQQTGIKLDEQQPQFDPLLLPKVDDPASVDRVEATFGIAIGTVVILMLVYFLSVGGLTLRFNPTDAGAVIPIPALWLVVLISACLGMILLHIVILRRNRWNIGLWLTESVLELAGVIGLYFVLYKPLVERLIASNPSLTAVPLVQPAPEIIVVVTAAIIVIGKGIKLMQLWSYPPDHAPT